MIFNINIVIYIYFLNNIRYLINIYKDNKFYIKFFI